MFGNAKWQKALLCLEQSSLPPNCQFFAPTPILFLKAASSDINFILQDNHFIWQKAWHCKNQPHRAEFAFNVHKHAQYCGLQTKLTSPINKYFNIYLHKNLTRKLLWNTKSINILSYNAIDVFVRRHLLICFRFVNNRCTFMAAFIYIWHIK